MLKSFRNASNSIIIKILFGAIILSFCLWGVGDIIKNYSASKPVFSVGKFNVTAEMFMRDYNKERQDLRNSGEKPLSDDEIKKIDVKGMVLEKMMQDAVLDQTLTKLNIIIPKNSIMGVIHSLPEFQRNGIFDEKIYENAIKRSGINESGFLHQIRGNLAKTQLLHPIMTGYKIPESIKDKIAKEFEIKKTLLVATIDVSNMKIDAEPTSEEIKQYFDLNSDKYKKPETRDAAVLIIDYKNLSSDLKISKEDIDAYYEANKSSFKSAEKRSFERFNFEKKEDADNAWNMMNKGIKTEEIVKKFKTEVTEISAREKNEFPEQIAKDLYELKVNHTSPVYEISGAFYIYRLSKIDLPKQNNEAELKKEVEKILQNEKINSPEFYSKIKDMRNKIDDGFGSGKTIDEVAKETGMKIVELKSIQKEEIKPELEHITKENEVKNDILNAIFSTEQSQASQIIDSKETDTLSYVVYTRKIEKEALPPLESVIEKVKERIITEKKDRKATEKINGILNKGKDSAVEVEKLNGVQKFVVSKKDVLLHQKHPSTEVERILTDIPNLNIVLEMLSTLKKGESTYFKLPNNDYILISVQDKVETKDSSNEFQEIISKYVDSGSGKDVSSIAMLAFKSQLKINVDQHLLDLITTSVDENEENR